MGAKSTICLTRQECIEEITKKVKQASANDLAATLEALVGNRLLYNFMIVNEGDSEYDRGMFD